MVDVHVRGEYPTYMKRYFRENNIEIKLEDGDEEISKKWTCRLLYHLVIICQYVPAKPMKKPQKEVEGYIMEALQIHTLKHLIGDGR